MKPTASTRTGKRAGLLALFLLAFFMQAKVYAQCPIQFYNDIDCGASVDITWSFEDCSATPCGTSSSATYPFGGFYTIPCDPGCTSTCNIIITVTAINGCPITPTSLDWLTAFNTPGGKALVVLPCPPVSCLPSNCCDNGTALIIDTNTGLVVVD